MTRAASGAIEFAERCRTVAEQRGAALAPDEQAAVDKVALDFARRQEPWTERAAQS